MGNAARANACCAGHAAVVAPASPPAPPVPAPTPPLAPVPPVDNAPALPPAATPPLPVPPDALPPDPPGAPAPAAPAAWLAPEAPELPVEDPKPSEQPTRSRATQPTDFNAAIDVMYGNLAAELPSRKVGQNADHLAIERFGTINASSAGGSGLRQLPRDAAESGLRWQSEQRCGRLLQTRHRPLVRRAVLAASRQGYHPRGPCAGAK